MPDSTEPPHHANAPGLYQRYSGGEYLNSPPSHRFHTTALITINDRLANTNSTEINRNDGEIVGIAL